MHHKIYYSFHVWYKQVINDIQNTVLQELLIFERTLAFTVRLQHDGLQQKP